MRKPYKTCAEILENFCITHTKWDNVESVFNSVFFMDHLLRVPDYPKSAISKFAQMFSTSCEPPVSTIPVVNGENARRFFSYCINFLDTIR